MFGFPVSLYFFCFNIFIWLAAFWPIFDFDPDIYLIVPRRESISNVILSLSSSVAALLSDCLSLFNFKLYDLGAMRFFPMIPIPVTKTGLLPSRYFIWCDYNSKERTTSLISFNKVPSTKFPDIIKSSPRTE